MSARSRQAEAEQQRRRRNALIGVVVAVVLVVGALVVVLALGGDDEAGTATEPTATVSMVEMAFVPDPIEVAQQDAVLRIVNDGEEPHSMLIPDLGKGTPDLKPGQELVLDLTQVEPGEYYVFCDIPGHREAGMETTLIVEKD